MKISLNWVFDHIKGDLATVDVAHLVDRFIKTTAEIEAWKKVTCVIDDFTLVQVTTISVDAIVVHCTEYNKEYRLPVRADAIIGLWYVIAHNSNQPCWATAGMFGGTKDLLLPSLSVAQAMRAGGWKKTVERDDYIIDIDNKSINSRPDLWGHRGIAREIAAILDMPLRPLREFIIDKDIIAHRSASSADAHNPYAITIQADDVCTRFAALYISSITPQPSQLSMAMRLCRLDSRAIDLLVDATNYVMLDLGQPMHAFDAHQLPEKQIIIRRAHTHEKLMLLDSETVELTSDDLVIADGDKAISLAGIMGGVSTSITANTHAVFVESAHFDATTIRRTAARHKKRTEASMRFEKSLDPHQNSDALMRFLFLLEQAGVVYQASGPIISLGTLPQHKTIFIEHAFIQARLGVIIQPASIVALLEKLSFGVVQSVENDAVGYTVTVPTFRGTKDIKIPEDIVEEVGRYIGYDVIPRVMPSLQLCPSDLHATYCTRRIKHLVSFGLLMRELYGYSFFDESALRKLAWQPVDYVAIKNPISENYTRLVTTLQPHLLAAIEENSIHHNQLRFFEWGRVWHMHGGDIVEQKSLSGIFFDGTISGHVGIDFYAGKSFVQRIFDEVGMEIAWRPHDDVNFPWLVWHQSATLMHNETRVGIAGMVEKSVVNALSPAGGAAFIFELDADYLLNYKKQAVRFVPLSKYPSVRRDVSILISVAVTADELMQMIKSVDQLIDAVQLIDFFIKPEWKEQKAMTFHVEICDREKTLGADDVERIWNGVVAVLCSRGAVIR